MANEVAGYVYATYEDTARRAGALLHDAEHADPPDETEQEQ